ncbi:outer membrane beta-barrel protein [Sphingomonas sp.]|uniref:outer membrane protein n=1 Tax=Sphingomonas sp. TaxID=28214 RepID=UPI0025FAEE27|nr:outer membrane beta-barrel protein [Sphingomonas sp.]
MNRVSAAGLLRPKSKRAIQIAVGAFAFAATAAPAQTTDRWYVAGAVTGSALNKPHQTIANAPVPGSTLQVSNNVDFGWGGQAAVGRSLGSLRLEAEVGRTANKSKSYTVTSPIQVTLPQDGKNNVTRFMANVYFDVPLTHFPVQPYLGAGIGAADTRVTTFAAPARAPMAPPSQLLDIRKTVFAYQVIGGVGLRLASNLRLTAQYRWFEAGTVKGHDSRGEAATRHLAGSNVDVGFRFLF